MILKSTYHGCILWCIALKAIIFINLSCGQFLTIKTKNPFFCKINFFILISYGRNN